MEEIRDVTAIVRSVGERTEESCRRLLAEQIPPDNVVVVRDAPFSATLAQSFRIGLERGLTWTFCVDADVLPLPDAVRDLRESARAAGDNVCEVQGLVLDKFFGDIRAAGNHLYRTAALRTALDLIPAEGLASPTASTKKPLRPELLVLNAMKDRGYPWIQTAQTVGLHGFEQYYRDVFRTCFVQAHKHDWVVARLARFWRRMAAQDRDYEVALRGVGAGIAEIGQPRIDVRAFPQGGTAVLGLAGLSEKPDIGPGEAITSSQVAAVVTSWVVPPECERLLRRKITQTGSGPTAPNPPAGSSLSTPAKA
jgi:hypothetical protein